MVEISLAKGIILKTIGLANSTILELWAAHPYSQGLAYFLLERIFNIMPYTLYIVQVVTLHEGVTNEI